ncbi:MAG: FxsA family protein [Pseudomonadales bacterium]|nr:FxsA family protein [Pseudomonadales bacterium]MDG1441344.1 FxsA family protein [Pseudomonadales bacterium]
MRIALFFFILIPILEMYILIQVGSYIGAIPTIALVVLTATIGIWLLRLEGLSTLNRVQEKLNAGQIPGTELLEGVMLLVGGALLLTPGFATDAIGFCCLLPFLRRPIATWLMHKGVLGAMQFGSSPFSANNYHQPEGVIDGEFEVPATFEETNAKQTIDKSHVSTSDDSSDR